MITKTILRCNPCKGSSCHLSMFERPSTFECLSTSRIVQKINNRFRGFQVGQAETDRLYYANLVIHISEENYKFSYYLSNEKKDADQHAQV